MWPNWTYPKIPTNAPSLTLLNNAILLVQSIHYPPKQPKKNANLSTSAYPSHVASFKAKRSSLVRCGSLPAVGIGAALHSPVGMVGPWGIGFTRQSTWLISRLEMLFVRSHNTTFWSRRSSILIRFEWSSQLRPKIKALGCSFLDSGTETTSNSWNTTTEWYRILPNITEYCFAVSVPCYSQTPSPPAWGYQGHPTQTWPWRPRRSCGQHCHCPVHRPPRAVRRGHAYTCGGTGTRSNRSNRGLFMWSQFHRQTLFGFL